MHNGLHVRPQARLGDAQTHLDLLCPYLQWYDWLVNTSTFIQLVWQSKPCVLKRHEFLVPFSWSWLEKGERNVFIFNQILGDNLELKGLSRSGLWTWLWHRQTWRRHLYVWCSHPWNGESSESSSFWERKDRQHNYAGAPKWKGLEKLKKEFGGY